MPYDSPEQPPAAPPPWMLTPEAALKMLRARVDGLDEDETARRRTELGPNRPARSAARTTSPGHDASSPARATQVR